MKMSTWKVTRDLAIDFLFYSIVFLAMNSLNMFVIMEKETTLGQSFGMLFFLMAWGWQVWLSMLLFWVGGGIFAFSLSTNGKEPESEEGYRATIGLFLLAMGIFVLMMNFYNRISELKQNPILVTLILVLLGTTLSLQSYFKQKKKKEV